MKIMIMVARHVVWQSFRRSGEAFQALAERGRGRRRFNGFNLDAGAFAQSRLAFQHHNTALDGSIEFHFVLHRTRRGI